MNGIANNHNLSREERLCGTVMKKIAMRRVHKARAAVVVHGGLVLGAMLAFWPALSYAAARAADSGFSGYVSLIVSDGLQMAGAWKPLSLSLAESIPLFGSILVVATLFIFAYSARKMAGDIGRLHYSHSLS
jgi:uncharacterized membrane protein YhaH (DUF805 family)